MARGAYGGDSTVPTRCEFLLDATGMQRFVVLPARLRSAACLAIVMNVPQRNIFG